MHMSWNTLYTGDETKLACSKTCLVRLLIRSIFRGKKCTSASVRVHFFQQKSNESTDQQDMFCFKHASTFYTSNINDKKND